MSFCDLARIHEFAIKGGSHYEFSRKSFLEKEIGN